MVSHLFYCAFSLMNGHLSTFTVGIIIPKITPAITLTHPLSTHTHPPCSNEISFKPPSNHWKKYPPPSSTTLARSVRLVQFLLRCTPHGIILIQILPRDLLQQFLWEGPENTPCQIQTLKDCSCLVHWEIVFMSINCILKFHKWCLSCNLGCHLIVGQTGRWKDGDLLSTCDRVHDINGWYASLDHSLGIIPWGGVDWLAINIEIGLRSTFGLKSITFPEPLNDQPSISLDTPILRTSPVNSHRVLHLSMSDVPSKTCMTAREPATSRTWPDSIVPSPRVRLTISAYFGSGPLTPAMVLFFNSLRYPWLHPRGVAPLFSTRHRTALPLVPTCTCRSPSPFHYNIMEDKHYLESSFVFQAFLFRVNPSSLSNCGLKYLWCSPPK